MATLTGFPGSRWKKLSEKRASKTSTSSHTQSAGANSGQYKPMVQARMEDILQERNPDTVQIDLK